MIKELLIIQLVLWIIHFGNFANLPFWLLWFPTFFFGLGIIGAIITILIIWSIKND